MTKTTIIYTQTDEAPALATYAFLPIVQAFTSAADIDIEVWDISLAARILASFPEYLTNEQQKEDALAKLGKLTLTPEANIIKLPNISATIPQIKAAVNELQSKGYNIPDFIDVATNAKEEDIKSRYAKVGGSAVNPVIRQGNSDRRVATAVKQYAKQNPHTMGKWSTDSKTHVVSMSENDYHSTEQSVVLDKDDVVKIEIVDEKGNSAVLKESTPLVKDEVIDSAVMNMRSMRDFYIKAMDDAKEEGILFSLHLKATMMKTAGPIFFGVAVKSFFQNVFDKYATVFETLDINPNDGLTVLYSKIASLPDDQRAAIEADIQATYADRPAVAMIDSDKGITNLHAPNLMIVDASMAAMIRSSGKLWNADGQLQDTKAVMPNQNYAGVYQATIDFCKEHGAFDVTTMGSVSNVGLMAQKAEEYGSHDKTFAAPFTGTIKVKDSSGNTLMEQAVEQGDVFRMCQTKDAPVRDWVRLAVERTRLTGYPAVFWLDPNRAHDSQLITKVNTYLKDHDTDGLDIRIMSHVDATLFTLQQIKEGNDVISVTGNVLRDYLTDLFPILELGTSSKMLSIVPLLAGGGLFETGAGGTAPKHVEQLISENHLRWDSLGEYLALAVSLADLANKTGNTKAKILADALDTASSHYLSNNKAPSRKVNELDNRGSSFYLALYWAQALAEQKVDTELQQHFSLLAKVLSENEACIVDELNNAQGQTIDIGGYYMLDETLANAAMCPSATFNAAIAAI